MATEYHLDSSIVERIGRVKEPCGFVMFGEYAPGDYYSLFDLRGTPADYTVIRTMLNKDKSLEAIPFNQNIPLDKGRLVNIIDINAIRSRKRITKFLTLAPRGVFLYTTESKGPKSESELVDMSGQLGLYSLYQLSEIEKEFIGSKRKAVAPSIKEFGALMGANETLTRMAKREGIKLDSALFY